MSKENICYYHDEIIERAKNICKIEEKIEKEINKECYSKIEDMLYDIHILAEEIIDFTKYAKTAGEKMENRLREYKETIEGLGFKRIRNS